MRILLIFLVSGFCVCSGVRIKHVPWWLAKIKGQDFIAEEIDGNYRATIRDANKPQYQIYRKGSEALLKYITQYNWNFHMDDFEDDDMLLYENINIVLEGIDTAGTINLNNEVVGSVNNMFIPYYFNITKLYQDDYNMVSVVLLPLFTQAATQYDKIKKNTKLYPECTPSSYHGRCYVFMLRTKQSCFGSALGPPLPSVGIWRPVYVEAYNETTFRDISTTTEEHDNDWLLNVSVYFANNTRHVINGKLEFSILDIKSTDNVIITANNQGEFVFEKVISIPKEKVERWWPVGYGNQSLYELKIQFYSGKGETIDRKLRIGFRKVELIEEKIGEGASFYFKVNDRPIFMKGAIMAPIHLQPELAQETDRIKKLFSLALAQNMNTIRVWGGGIYQVDKFYELADEMGLMIWQDFMFLDLSYPTTSKFLKSVRTEVRYQTRRLINHPSVVVFCGNDEGELSLAENRYEQNKSKTVQDDYLELFEKTVKSEFRKVTNGTGIFLTSTPSNGKISKGIIAKDPNNILYGDVHFFDYVNDPFKHGTYPTPRFVSAYGIQSYPKVESFLKDTNDTNDLNFTGTFLHNRQHLPDGFGIMKKLIAHQIIMKPSNDLEKYARTFSYYSQVIQAYGMRIQTERYRSYRSIKTKDGLGRTMGALYWHFNDVWTAPTWSGIDYFGEWKMLQYYVKEFFSPIIVTGQLEEEENGKTKLDIFVVSDFDKIENADVKIKLGKWNEIGIFNETSFSVSVDASSSKLVQTIDTKKLFSDRGCTKEDCFIYLTLEANGKLIAPNNFILPNPLKNCNLAQPSLKHHLRKLPYVQIYEIIINTDKNALFVWLDAHGIDGRFSENGFLQTTPSKQVFFYSSVDTNENELRKILTVVHVNDKSLQ